MQQQFKGAGILKRLTQCLAEGQTTLESVLWGRQQGVHVTCIQEEQWNASAGSR